MKKSVLPILVLLSALAAAAPVSACETSATTASLDGTKVPGEKGLARVLADGDELVKKHCTGCHTEGRIMNAMQAMRGEQAETFEKQMKGIILRKIRLTNGNISRQDGKKIIDYLCAVWQRQKPLATLFMPALPDPAPRRS